MMQLSRRSFLASAVKRRRPNIVLIMADDMGYSDLGCYGSEIDTPNLNRLANDGVRFTHFTNTARCCPSRASLLTGLYSHQVGIGHMTGDDGFPGYRGTLSKNHATIAEALKPAGYKTGAFGKWHVCPGDPKHKDNFPLQRGFDSYVGTLDGGGNYFDPARFMIGNDVQPKAKDGFYLTDVLADATSKFIREQEGTGKPFFTYLALTSPHWPLHAFEKDIARYSTKYKDGWDKTRADRYERMKKLKVVDRKWGLSPRDPSVDDWQKTPNKDWQMRRMAVYAAQIETMDRAIGRVLDSLRQTKAMEDTLVLFLSDNGASAENLNESAGLPNYSAHTHDGILMQRGNDGKTMPGSEATFQSYGRDWTHVSNTPFRLHKSVVHEGGIATPLIAHWPSSLKNRGRVDREDSPLIDLMATCCDVGEVQLPNAIEGKSLRPILEARPRVGHQALFYEHEGNRAIRKQGWKLVAEAKKPWELYNLREDRCERNNLAATRPEKAKQLEGDYRQWANRAQVVDWDEILQSRRKRSPLAK